MYIKNQTTALHPGVLQIVNYLVRDDHAEESGSDFNRRPNCTIQP